MAKYLKRAEGIAVSHNFVAQVWRDHDLQPQRLGTFKLSNDPEFEAKVADVVGLHRLFDLRRAPSVSSLTIGGFAGCSATVLDAGSCAGS